MERVTSILMKVKSCNVWLRVSLVCVIVYLKLYFIYKYFILEIYDADTVYLHEEGCVKRNYFSKTKGPLEQNGGETYVYVLHRKMGWPYCWSRNSEGSSKMLTTARIWPCRVAFKLCSITVRNSADDHQVFLQARLLLMQWTTTDLIAFGLMFIFPLSFCALFAMFHVLCTVNYE
jgi:hypothetical protein